MASRSERTDGRSTVLWIAWRRAGLSVSVHKRFGNPPNEVLAEVDELVPDLVVVGRRGLGRAASLMFGSVSSSLLRHSAVPVLTVP